MKDIKENVRKLGYEHKAIWKDGNDVVETWTESRKIDLDKLREELLSLQSQATPLTDEQYIELGKLSCHAPDLQQRIEELQRQIEQYG